MSENIKKGLETLGGLIKPLAKLEECFIGYLDLLGFSEVIKNNSVEFLEHIYSQFYNISLVNISRNPPKLGFFDNIPISIADLSDVLVNMLFVSDSIILWSEDTSIISFHKMLIALSRFLTHGFQFHIPIRGALTKGLFSYNPMQEETDLMVSGQLVYGPGLVAAIDLEKDQMWAGCIVDDECMNYYEKLVQARAPVSARAQAGIEVLNSVNWVIRYPVPFRNKTEECFVINWNRENDIDQSTIREAFSDYNKPTDLDSVKIKIKNTLKFLRHTTK